MLRAVAWAGAVAAYMFAVGSTHERTRRRYGHLDLSTGDCAMVGRPGHDALALLTARNGSRGERRAKPRGGCAQRGGCRGLGAGSGSRGWS